MTPSRIETMKRSEAIFRFVALAVAAAALLLVLWFAVWLTRDAIYTSLQRFESAPSEGWNYWYRAELLSNLKDLAIPALIWCGLFVLVIRGIVRTAKHLTIKQHSTHVA